MRKLPGSGNSVRQLRRVMETAAAVVSKRVCAAALLRLFSAMIYHRSLVRHHLLESSTITLSRQYTGESDPLGESLSFFTHLC
jgi:hypothetical protein